MIFITVSAPAHATFSIWLTFYPEKSLENSTSKLHLSLNYKIACTKYLVSVVTLDNTIL